MGFDEFAATGAVYTFGEVVEFKDSTLAEAHSILADVHVQEWNWAGAEAEYERAIELNPSLAQARARQSIYLMLMKRPEEAMTQIQRAMELDPLNVTLKGPYGLDLYFAGRYDEAIVQFRKVLSTLPDHRFARWDLAITLFQKGLYEESLAEFKAVYAGDREMEEALTQGYEQSGYRGAMRRAADVLAERSRKTYVLPGNVATLYIHAGEGARALVWLERGFEARAPGIGINVNPTFESLRSEPRFQDLLRQMNLPQ